MKIERETDREYRRWSVETHPWVEKSVAALVFTLITGVLGVSSGVAHLLGW